MTDSSSSGGRSSNCARVLVVAAAIHLGIPLPGESQQSGAAGRICRKCRIVLDSVATIEGPSRVGSPMSIVQLSNGRFYATYYPGGEEIYEYDAQGAFVRKVSQKGNGAGETQYITHLLLLTGDTLLAFDASLGKMLIFDSNGDFVDARPSPGRVYDGVAGRDSILWLNSEIITPTLVGIPLHATTRSGRILTSFGDVQGGVFRPAMRFQSMRSMTSGGDGVIWTAPRTAYQLEGFDETGRITARWSRNATWFPTYFEPRQVTPAVPPEPLFVDIQSLSPTLVLTLIIRPQEDYTLHLGRSLTQKDGRVVYPFQDFANVYDTLLELWDVKEGSVVASLERPQAFVQFLNASHVASVRQGKAGRVTIDIWRMRVSQ